MNKDVKVTIYDDNNTRTVLRTDSIVDEVVDRFIDRASFGKSKYNTDMDREDLSLDEWVNHAIEEAMDFVVYMTKIKRIISGKKGKP